ELWRAELALEIRELTAQAAEAAAQTAQAGSRRTDVGLEPLQLIAEPREAGRRGSAEGLLRGGAAALERALEVGGVALGLVGVDLRVVLDGAARAAALTHAGSPSSLSPPITAATACGSAINAASLASVPVGAGGSGGAIRAAITAAAASRNPARS